RALCQIGREPFRSTLRLTLLILSHASKQKGGISRLSTSGKALAQDQQRSRCATGLSGEARDIGQTHQLCGVGAFTDLVESLSLNRGPCSRIVSLSRQLAPARRQCLATFRACFGRGR